jgi:HlyD family secretion protein
MAKKKSSNRLLIILVSAVVILLVVAVVAKQAGWIGQEKATEVEIAAAKQTDIIERVSASGKVQPEVEVKISPDVSGEIIELHVSEGDSVVQGQLILKIRPDNYISQVDRARATVNTNKANLAQSAARVAQAEAQLIRSKAAYTRNQQLLEQKVISSADFEQIEADYNVAEQEVESARQSLQAARYNVLSAEASLREAQENLSRTAIYAPVNGTISKLDVEKGERVVGTMQMAGTEMLRIANLNNMEVRVDVNENDIVRVHQGDTAIIEVDSYTRMDRKFKGVVTEIANTAKEALAQDAVTEFQVKIRILNESYADLTRNGSLSPFRPGMTASVEIITNRKNGVLSVPLASVTMRNPNAKKGDEPPAGEGPPAQPVSTNPASGTKAEEMKEVVFVMKDGKAQLREVKTGISDYENIEIVSGLEPGEEVISGPFLVVSKRLNDGELVKKKEEGKGKNSNAPIRAGN